MDFQLIDNQEKWNEFIVGQEHAHFLQSWEWGEFQKEYGRRVWRLGSWEGEKQILAGQIIEHYLGLGTAYFYLPRGPVLKENNPQAILQMVDFIKQKLTNYGTLFIKVEAQLPENIVLPNIIRRPSVQPANTVVLDLEKTEGDLLSYMHQKTRYNIRLAYKKGLSWQIDLDEGFKKAWPLFKNTSRRDKISSHPLKYYQLMEKKLINQEKISFKKMFVFYNNQPLAVGLFIGFGDTFTYLHGASSNYHRELMAPYMLQWEAIKYAQKQGYKYYDLGGVNPTDKNDFEYRYKWEGISRFKYGFGGEIYNFGNTYELVLKTKAYQLFSLAKKIKRLI